MMSQQPTEEGYVAYSPIIDRPPVRWPGGARVAVWVAPNVEHYEYLPPPSRFGDPWPRTAHPDVREYARRDWGNRVGFWRMLEVLDHHRVRATVSLNVAVLDHFPQIRDAIVARDWAIMSHGLYNTRTLFGMSEEEERAFYRETCEIVERNTGVSLRGMLGPTFSATPNTPRLMAEAGFRYQVDWFIDDQPFPIRVPEGRLCGVPYAWHLNDGLIFYGADDADHFVQMCKDQLDCLLDEGAESGRVMCMSLHPFFFGQPHRVAPLDQALEHVMSREGVWMATADEIADWYLRHHHDEHLAYEDASSRALRSTDPDRGGAA